MYAIFEGLTAYGDLSAAIHEETHVFPNDGTAQEEWAASQVTVSEVHHSEWVDEPHRDGHTVRAFRITARRVMISGRVHTIMRIIGNMARHGCPELLSAGRL
jgi:hypothetical protein